MSAILINYAHRKYLRAQVRQCETASRYWKFDRIRSFSLMDLDAGFKEKNSYILSQERGAGCFLWKPYVIQKALSESSDGDIILYADSGTYFTDSPKRILDLVGSVGILVFRLWRHYEFAWTKRDAFVLMECDAPSYVHTRQRLATYFACVNDKRSRSFVSEWVEYGCDRRIITGDPNVMGLPNYAGFSQERWDQSILSLLSKKWGLPAFCNPSQWGNEDPLFKVHFPSTFYKDNKSE